MDERLESIADGEEAEAAAAAAKVDKVPVLARVTLVERDVRGHSRSIATITQVLRDQGKALTEIEEWRMKALLDEVRREEQQKALILRLDQMNTAFTEGVKAVRRDVGDMRSTWTRIMWTIGSPIMVAMVLALLAITFGKGIPPIS